MYKLSTFLFALLFSITLSTQSYSQTQLFFDNFDSYTAGNFVACSNPTVWTTWSNAPCGPEDAVVSSTYSYSVSNSAKIIQNDDLVKDFGPAYTSGKYKISFQVYIPATKAGYFNTLATFAGGSSSWGMECYFDAGGAGRLNGGSATAVTFTWPVATWFLVEHVVDLDANQSQMTINGTLVHTWQWTLGANGAGCPLTLDANDFFGATANDEMYFDNYALYDMAPPPPVFFENFDSYTAGNLVACSNPTVWTTWSNAPCGPEDALVSNTFSFSSPNSAKILQNDDLVKDFGPAYTSGKYKISFRVYIPAAKAGYFNTLATFAGGTSDWALEVYFDAGGAGRVNPNGPVPATFTWTAGQWNLVEHIVDLDNNLGEVKFNSVLIHSQQYTLGAYTTVVPLTLDANDFFGATANDEMYFDDYTLENLTVVPVELSAFTANVNNGNVVLNWTTETELNNQGFEIERRSSEGQFVTIGQVQGNGTTTERQQYSFTDAGVLEGSYYYRLKQVDFNGAYEYSNEIFVDVPFIAPLDFALNQNYPNPFNPSTSINFSLAEPTFVKLAVYNLLGEVVQVLKNENMTAGSYNVTFDASSLPSGMYLYKIETVQFTSVRKMMLMK
jgi:hypothetical protein